MVQKQATLPNTHGGVRGIINDNATDAETRLAKADKCRVGFADYNDLGTHTTPLSITSTSGWTILPNDKLGPFTNDSFLPEGVPDVLGSNVLDLSHLSLGDMINIREDVTVTTTSPNQVVSTQMRVAVGSPIEFTIPFTSSQYKLAGTYNLNRFNGLYIGSVDVRDYPAQLEISSDGNATVVVNGWYIQLLLRGEAS